MASVSLLLASVEKMCVSDVHEDGSWYCRMFRCFSFNMLPLSSLSMNFMTGWRSGSGPPTRRMMVYPSPNLSTRPAAEPPHTHTHTWATLWV